MNQPNSTPDKPDDQMTFAISMNEFSHLLHEPHSSFFEAGLAIIGKLREKGIDAKVVPGGLRMYIHPSQMIDATMLLDELKIDISQLSDKTFHAQLTKSGSLEKLASQDPLGFGARVLNKITENLN